MAGHQELYEKAFLQYIWHSNSWVRDEKRFLGSELRSHFLLKSCTLDQVAFASTFVNIDIV